MNRQNLRSFEDGDTIYNQLEAQIPRYEDIRGIPIQETGDGFVLLPNETRGNIGVIGCYGRLTDMKESFPLVPVRREVRDKLNKAQELLREFNPRLQLVVAYGYRSIEVQHQYFREQREMFKRERHNGETEEEIDEIIHRTSIAVPEVAGHPTGGAVDVFIAEDDSPLDLGTPIFSFERDTLALSPFINEEAQKNRQLLRQIMFAQNFAPYDGEWWHFSFGDKEWAYYDQKQYAIYGQKSPEEVLDSLVNK